MKNLHKIQSNWTDRQLATLEHLQRAKYKIKVQNNDIYYLPSGENIWLRAGYQAKVWDAVASWWLKERKMPDFSTLIIE